MNIALGFALVVFPSMAFAATDSESPKPMLPEPVPAEVSQLEAVIASQPTGATACIWNSKLYSDGAVFCVERSASVICQPNGKWMFARTGDCDPNPALTPPAN